jgi:hypothetical protein
MLRVSIELPTVFTWSLGVFTQSSELWVQLIETFV